MTEDELQQKRAEFRDSEVQRKIETLSSADEYRQASLKTHYTSRRVQMGFGKMGWTIVITQASFLVFFSLLFLMSYVPKTKFIVTKIMP